MGASCSRCRSTAIDDNDALPDLAPDGVGTTPSGPSGAVPNGHAPGKQSMPSRTVSVAGSVYFDAEDGEWHGQGGGQPAHNPQLNAYLAAGSFSRAMSRSSTMSGVTVYADAHEELPDGRSVKGDSDDGHGPTSLPGSRQMSRAGSAASPRRSSSGAADVQPPARLSRKHSSGVQDTLARASMSFGTGHSKVELSADPARTDPPQYEAAVVKLCNRLFGGSAASMSDVPLLPVAPWNRRAGYLGYLTKEQEAALREMREGFPQSTAFHTDHDILRFLRAREFNMKATRAMYQHYLSMYRERFMVSPSPIVRPIIGDWPLDGVMDDFPLRPPPATEKLRKILDFYLHSMVYHTDRLGRPVVYLRVADMIKRSMGETVPLGDRITMQSASLEVNRVLCLLASKAAGYHIEEIMQVVDLGGVSTFALVKHQRSPENQAEWQHNADFNPETMGKIVLINCPTGAGAAWKVAQLLIPPRTAEKISICTSNYKNELRKLIDPVHLPSCYGGTAKFEWPAHRPLAELNY